MKADIALRPISASISLCVAPQSPAHDFGQARLEKIDLRTDDEDVAEPDWVLQPVATGPVTARTADIGTGAMPSAS
jgi:hypothetical protein